MPTSLSPKPSRPAKDIATRLLAVECKPENKFCSECSTRKPTWACTVVVKTSPGSGDESNRMMIGTLVCSPCSHAMGKLLKSASCGDIVDVKSLVGVDKNKCKYETWPKKQDVTRVCLSVYNVSLVYILPLTNPHTMMRYVHRDGESTDRLGGGREQDRKFNI